MEISWLSSFLFFFSLFLFLACLLLSFLASFRCEAAGSGVFKLVSILGSGGGGGGAGFVCFVLGRKERS